MLPLAALLNGIGIVMIYRLQESGRGGNPGLQISTLTAHAALYQLVWTAVGMVAFVVVLVVIRQPRILQRYTYTLGTIGLILLAIPALLPASLSARCNGAKVWIILGGFSIQPGEFARIALAVFFSGYLVAKRDVLSLAGRRFLGIDLPRGRDLGPILVFWAISLLILIFESDIGTSALFFGLFVAMLYIATQRTSWLLIGLLLFVAGALLARRDHPARARAIHDLAAPVRARQHPGLVLPARPGPGGDGVRRHLRHRARPGPAVPHPARAERLHLHRLRRGTRAHRAHGAAADLRLARPAWTARGPGGPRPVRQAAGRRAWPSCSRCRSSSSSAASPS